MNFNDLLHIDKTLEMALHSLGNITYLIIFGIIFVETGLIIFPFLPGDSLLFSLGTLSAKYPDQLNIFYIIPILFFAALIGDNSNYFLARKFGLSILEKSKHVRPEHLQKTHQFFAKHGGKALIMARFVPIVRTFAPFVAGLGKMDYSKFIKYCVLGAALWTISLTSLGYFLGNIPIIKNNFEKVVIGIILISVIPPIIEYFKSKKEVAKS